MTPAPKDSAAGILYALGAYGIWGVTPVYWKAIQTIPADEALGQRALWSFATALLLLAVARRFPEALHALRSFRQAAPIAVSALLIAANWLTFIHAVQTDRVLATSLGYYINPLVNVLFGLLFLRERLSGAQSLAVAIAGAGVAYLALDLGELPWISIVLAGSFGLYGLVRKTAPTEPLAGFSLEMLFLSPLALGYLLHLGGDQALPGAPPSHKLLMAVSGAVTAAPLLLFTSAARRLPLSTLGMFQYIAPSVALGLAVGLYGEPFTPAHFVGFGCVWLALALFSGDSFYRARRERSALRGASL